MKNYCSPLTTSLPPSVSSLRPLVLLAAVCSICISIIVQSPVTVVSAFTVSSSTSTGASSTSSARVSTRPVPASALLLLHAQNSNESTNGGNEDPSSSNEGGGLFSGVKAFFEELDAFVDDASARRLGNGAKFYGKRKSNFYGAGDSMKKADRNKYDATEDYRVTAGGNYKWVEDENGVMRPVTRLKNKVMERDP